MGCANSILGLFTRTSTRFNNQIEGSGENLTRQCYNLN
jgi:hypothetical protein